MTEEMITEIKKRKYMSPFGLADLQLQDLETNTGINIINIEPEFHS